MVVPDKNARMERKDNKRAHGETLSQCKRAHHETDNGDNAFAERDSCTGWLSNEVLDLVLNGRAHNTNIPYIDPCERWASALVCARWCAIIDAFARRPHPGQQPYGRLVGASCFVALARRPGSTVDDVREAIQAALERCSRAHLLPVLAASNCAHLVRYALATCKEIDIAEDKREAFEWTTCHDTLEQRVRCEWSQTLSSVYGSTPQTPHHARVLLSIVARYTQTPGVLQEAVALCAKGRDAICDALLSAIHADQDDVMGYLLVLYVYNHAYFSSGKQRRLANRVWTVVGAYGATRCANRLMQSFCRRECTAHALLTGTWRVQMCSDHFRRDDNNMHCTIDGMDDDAFLWKAAADKNLFWAAVTADRPDVLDAYSADITLAFQEDAFRVAARTGKRVVCGRLLAMFPRLAGQGGRMAINRKRGAPFTVDGVRWLGQQAWYVPDEKALCTILESLCKQKELTAMDIVGAMHSAVTAWPKHAHSVFAENHQLVVSVLTTCAAHPDGAKGLDSLARLLRDVGFFEPPCGRDLWSVMMNHFDFGGEPRHCFTCLHLPLGVVFGLVLDLHLRDPNPVTCCPRPIPLRYIGETHSGLGAYGTAADVQVQAIADRLTQYDLLVDPITCISAARQ